MREHISVFVKLPRLRSFVLGGTDLGALSNHCWSLLQNSYVWVVAWACAVARGSGNSEDAEMQPDDHQVNVSHCKLMEKSFVYVKQGCSTFLKQ